MKMIKKLLILITSLAYVGCASIEKSFTKTGDHNAAALSDSCPVSIYTTNPGKEFIELGVVDIDRVCGFFGCPKENETASGVKQFIAEEVCQAGGNGILLWQATGYGTYNKATVIKTK